MLVRFVVLGLIGGGAHVGEAESRILELYEPRQGHNFRVAARAAVAQPEGLGIVRRKLSELALVSSSGWRREGHPRSAPQAPLP